MKLIFSLIPLLLLFPNSLLAQEENLEEQILEFHNGCNKKLGEFYYAGRLPEGADFFANGIDSIEQKYGAEHACLGIWLEITGEIHRFAGRMDKVLPYLGRAERILKSAVGEETLYVADINLRYSNYYYGRGDYKKAEQSLLRALEILDICCPEHLNFGFYSNNLARVYGEMGEFDKAIALYEKALKHAEIHKGKLSPQYGTRLENLAVNYMNLNLIDKALNLFWEGKNVWETIEGDFTSNRNGGYVNLAMLYTQQAQFDSAFWYLNKIDTSRVSGFHGYQYYRLKGIMAYELGDYAAAEIDLNKTLAVGGRRNANFPTIYGMLADVYHQQGKQELAEKSINLGHELALEILPSTDSRLNTSYSNKAKFFKRSNDIDSLEHCMVKLSESIIEYFHNQLPFYDQRIQHQYILSEYADWYETLNSYAYLFPERDDIVRAAFETVTNTKSGLLDNFKYIEQQIEKEGDVALLGEYQAWRYNKQIVGKQLSKPIGRRPVLFDSLVEATERMEYDLAQKIKSFGEFRQKISLEKIQNVLTTNEAFIEIVEFKNKHNQEDKSSSYAAFIIKNGENAAQFVPLLNASDIKNINAIRRLYSYDPNNEINFSSLIWKPLASHLEGVETIYYAPSGMLHRVNFGAIPIDQNQIVADRFQVHQVGNSRQLIFPEIFTSEEEGEIAMFGGIEYNLEKDLSANTEVEQSDKEDFYNMGTAFRSLRGQKWEYLEWTKKEAETLRELFKSKETEVNYFEGRVATEEIFKALGKSENRANSPKVIHLATHGYFFPENPKTGENQNASFFETAKHPMIRSGLILAGANHVWQGANPLPGKEDGILTAYEIAQMDLRNTELVVLSACDTGLGDIEGNEGVYGLQRAFKMAGVKYILMSLWGVNDQKGYEFMTYFYKVWQEEGKTIPEAYISAQKFLREKYAQPFNPHGWAGFVLLE